MSLYWPTIAPGAIIDVIAPSGRFEASDLIAIQAFITKQGWRSRLGLDLLGDHDFLANSDAQRLTQLQHALTASDSEIIWCVRGGHGTTRLMRGLLTWPKPAKPKLVVGFSDITTLHLALNQIWAWPSLHAPMARQVSLGLADDRDVETLLALWRGGLNAYTLTDLIPHNALAHAVTQVTGTTAGTCLSLVQTSLGTAWQLQAEQKILFIEDVNEPAYRLDRMLVHLSNAGIWQRATAIVLGDFANQMASVEQAKIARVLTEFAKDQRVPVFSLNGFGHGVRNQPIPLGVQATIQPHAGSFHIQF